MRAVFLIFAIFLLAAPGAFALEVSTGFLIGPKYDPRAFYFRASVQNRWQKSYTGPEYRRQVQGKLFGAKVAEIDQLDGLKRGGLLLGVHPLQTSETNLFTPAGELRPGGRERLVSLLRAADARGMVLQLVLFSPALDQEFDSSDAIDAATRNVTDLLIAGNHRNVIVSLAENWSAAGWDFDNYVPQKLERLIDLIRDRIVETKTDFAFPIAVSVNTRLRPDSNLAQAGDVLQVSGEAMLLDPKLVERPELFLETPSANCAGIVERLAGCVVLDVAASRLAPIVFSRPQSD